MKVTHAVGSAIVKAATRKLAGLAGKSADEHVLAFREEAALQWSAETRRALIDLAEHLEGRIDDVEEGVNQMLARAEILCLCENLEHEAKREVLQERRRMLAHAQAGLFDPRMSLERKARVERTLRELDSDDVRVLHGLDLVPTALDEHGVRTSLLNSSTSRDVLRASGCLRFITPGGYDAGNEMTRISDIGTDVLRALRSYRTLIAPPFEIPGRDVRADDRPELEARSLLGAVPHLDAFLGWVRRRPGIASFTTRVEPYVKVPLLMIGVGDPVWVEPLTDLQANLRPLGIELAIVHEEYALRAGEAPVKDFRVDLTGPQDLLRHMADDCDALWVGIP